MTMCRHRIRHRHVWALFSALVMSLMALDTSAAEDMRRGATCVAASRPAKCVRGERCREPSKDRQVLSYVSGGRSTQPQLHDATCRADLYAGLTAVDCAAGRCTFELNGEIKPGMETAFERFVEEDLSRESRSGLTMFVNSIGGDMEAAMKIGFILREQQARVVVREGASCASACVFVLAGGVDRDAQGVVIIHRPYRATSVVLGWQEAQRQYEIRNATIRTYLQRMNVSPALLDAMNSIAPEDFRTLPAEDLKLYGLAGRDPVYQEELYAGEARRLGITMMQYLGKRKRYNECTQAVPDASPAVLSNCERILEQK
jgi:ATP-dependent protease ClpP protease subunit